MIEGHVSQLHALLPVAFRLHHHPDLAIEFVIDTGFTGFLTLPLDAVSALQLPYLESVYADLANGQVVELPVHAATILWQGLELEVRVLATGPRPLLGTGLLSGEELRVEFREGGQVSVTPIK